MTLRTEEIETGNVSQSHPEINWDGVTNSYIPKPDWKQRIHPSVKLHTETDANLDLITYEVIRHNLWMINEEHGTTVMKMSGSPVASVAMDFNPALYSEEGEEIFFGPYIQYLPAAAGVGVKWILENRSENPGIQDGDIFLTNDPWVGCNHQIDVTTFRPVFWKGEIFCWVCDTLHQYDMGGSVPGSFCVDAVDVFQEPTPQPPYKIVERGVMRKDLEDLFLRHSRFPDMAALDLRSQVAGLNVAATRIQELIERYGAGTVKAAMRKIVSDAERAFEKRIAELPDGKWQDVAFLEESTLGDRHVHKVVLTVRKEEGRLIFENEGTDPQVMGSLNNTFLGWKGAIMGALAVHFSYDQMYAVGGVLRHCEFRPTPGTISVASYPAAVSCGPSAEIINVLAQTHRLLSKMTRSSPVLNQEAYVGGAASTWPVATAYGINQWGHPVGTLMMDTMIGGLGAFTCRDGVSAGGNDWTPICAGPNIESNEQFFPLLYLYRKIRPDTGGAGRYRGGNTLSSAYVVHGSKQLGLDTASTGQGVPTGAGIFGGYPGAGNSHRLIQDSDFTSNWLAKGVLPSDISEVGGKSIQMPGKTKGTVLPLGRAVFEQTPCGGPGFGDPLDRPGEEVQLDIADGEVTIGHAEAVYGVVVDKDSLKLDEAATASRRQALLKERMQHGRRWIDSNPDAPEKKKSKVAAKNGRTGSLRFHENLEINYASGKSEICCIRCNHHLCASDENYKWYSLCHESPLTAVSPRSLDPKAFVDDVMVFRQFFCPKCAVLFENEIARKDDPPHLDIQIS